MSLVSDGQKTQKHFHHETDGEKNMIMDEDDGYQWLLYNGYRMIINDY